MWPSTNWWMKTARCEDNEVEATRARTLNTMPTSPIHGAILHLLADLTPDGDGMTDRELLARFVRSRDEDALAALVRRHASMVWGVCCRLLNHHDAEDAFQATFLVLVRKAAAVPKEAVANWLYGVARQTAVRVRATAAKRGRREAQVANMPEPTVPEVHDADVQRIVDEELSRLPDHYRGVVVLCDLEGMTRSAAARQLGIPEGSVSSRLARARALLAKRLNQRGIVLSGSVAAVWSAGSASASAPPALVASTIKAASLLAAGQAAGVVSVKVAALTEGVVKAMFVSKLKAAFSVVLILCVMATGATFLTYRTAAGQDDKKTSVEKPVEPAAKQEEKGKEPFTAWGKEVGGLQAGLGFRPGEHRVYHPGETVKLVVRVRNVGKEAAKFQYLKEYFIETPPTATDGKGKLVPFERFDAGGDHVPVVVNLVPGKEVELSELKLALGIAPQSVRPGQRNLIGTGKYNIQYDVQYKRLIRPDIDTVSKLSTGKLELEIEDEKENNKGERADAVAPQKDVEKAKDEDAIRGTWVAVKAEDVDKGAGDPKGDVKLVFKGDTMTVLASGSVKLEGKFTLDPAKKPKQIQLRFEKGEAKATVPGIYSLEGDELIVCCGRDGDEGPPVSFDLPKSRTGVTCWTLRREKDDQAKDKKPNAEKAMEPKAGEERSFEIANGVKMVFCWVPSGEAQLGSTRAERDEWMKYLSGIEIYKDVKEIYWVASEAEALRGKFKTKGFWLGKYTVTQEEWKAVMGENPSMFNGKLDNAAKGLDTTRFPVESVTWHDCQKFLEKVNGRAGMEKAFGQEGKCMLPHEDQWEYACRGGKGNNRPYFWGNELNGTQANCNGDLPFGALKSGEYLHRTCAVDFTNNGMYEKHPWGLCHMSGNVRQWCSNMYNKKDYVIRGGPFGSEAGFCRSASRLMYGPDSKGDNLGFRVCFTSEKE